MGDDFNVYLYAANHIGNGENIYINNPYNQYLYSPLFALLLKPLSFLNWNFSKLIWILMGTAALLRLWHIFTKIIDESFGDTKGYKTWVAIGVLIISLGFINRNIALGQITILLLWLTIEGIYRVMTGKKISGAALLALGINIKIIPVLALIYLFLKQKYTALVLAVFMVGISLFLPAVFIGVQYNNSLLHHWSETINPAGKKYLFEDDDGSSSLNSTLPAYFLSDFNKPDVKRTYQRLLLPLSYNTLVIVLQMLRVVLLISILFLTFYRKNNRALNGIYLLWEIGYVMLVSILLFPHQLGYSMLYFVPAGAYVILFFAVLLNSKGNLTIKEKIIGILSALIMLLMGIDGRDIIGNQLVDILAFYHFMALSVIALLGILFLCSPSGLEDIAVKRVRGLN